MFQTILESPWSHMIQRPASNALFNQLLTWEHKREHCSNALMLYYPTEVFTVLQPSHLIKVINLQQLAQRINNWFRCKVPPPSYAAVYLFWQLIKLAAQPIWEKNIQWLILHDVSSAACSFKFFPLSDVTFLELNLIFTLCLCTGKDKQWKKYFGLAIYSTKTIFYIHTRYKTSSLPSCLLCHFILYA